MAKTHCVIAHNMKLTWKITGSASSCKSNDKSQVPSVMSKSCFAWKRRTHLLFIEKTAYTTKTVLLFSLSSPAIDDLNSIYLAPLLAEFSLFVHHVIYCQLVHFVLNAGQLENK